MLASFVRLANCLSLLVTASLLPYEEVMGDQLDIVSLLPADGRVAGYHKIASGLDLSPSHLAAYEEAIEKALDMAIATRSTPPPVYKKRVYPAGLFKFGANLTQGQFVLLRDKQPDSAFPVRGGFEESGRLRSRDECRSDLLGNLSIDDFAVGLPLERWAARTESCSASSSAACS